MVENLFLSIQNYSSTRSKQSSRKSRFEKALTWLGSRSPRDGVFKGFLCQYLFRSLETEKRFSNSFLIKEIGRSVGKSKKVDILKKYNEERRWRIISPESTMYRVYSFIRGSRKRPHLSIVYGNKYEIYFQQLGICRHTGLTHGLWVFKGGWFPLKHSCSLSSTG